VCFFLNQLNVFSQTEIKDGGLAAEPGTAVGFVGAGCWVTELAVEWILRNLSQEKAVHADFTAGIG